MMKRRAPTIDGFLYPAETFAVRGLIAAVLLCPVAACTSEQKAPTSNTAEVARDRPAVVPAPTTASVPAVAPAVAPAAQELKLAGRANDDALAAALAEAQRQGMTGVTTSKAQSFRIVAGDRNVATVLTGEGKMPDAINPGCFVAIQQGDDIQLIPTLGYGNYDAETCGGPLAVGILSSNDPVRFGIVFRGYSRDAETSVPIVVNWNRSDNSLLIDTASTTKASESGATSIAAMRRLIVPQ